MRHKELEARSSEASGCTGSSGSGGVNRPSEVEMMEPATEPWL